MDPIQYMLTRDKPCNEGKVSTRVPIALQKVFLTSGGGKEVNEAPAGNVASKTFPTKNKGKMSTRYYIPKVAWLFKSKPRRKSNGENLRTDTADLTVANTADVSSSTVANIEIFTTVPDKIQVMKMSETKEVSNSSAQSPEHPESELSPQDYLDRLLSSRGYSTCPKNTLKSGYHATPTRLQQASYHDHLVSLARCGRHNRLKEIMECGISYNPCNTFGESLVHTVCRRCEPETLQILLDAGTSLQVSDDYGRTPLHDACWRPEPCFGIIELIASKDLYLFHMADCRGILPLSYVPKEQWKQWNKFLESKKDIWWPSGEPPKSSSVAHLAPNSRQIPDPKNALKLEIAALVSAGRLRPKDAINLNMDENSSDLLDSQEEVVSDDEESVSSVTDSSADDSFSAAEDDLGDILNLIESAKRFYAS